MVKFFITSRGEPWLQKYYDREPMNSQLEIYSLGDEEKESVERDIEAFLKQELPPLVRSLVDYASDWPGEEKRKALVRKSQGLFIFVSTAVRIITDTNVGRDPDNELERLLSSDHPSHLDGIYEQILERACPRTIDVEIVALFRGVLGALVVAREPINIHMLASLLCPDGSQLQKFTSLIRRKVLSYLQAVLVIPGVNIVEQVADAQPIQFIHTSFVDYLTDRARCGSRFLVHPPEHHGHAAIACFRKMQGLTRNICDLDPSLLNSEIKDLSQRIRERMPQALQYACVHVAVHVSQTAAGNADIRGLLTGLTRERLMYWLECLSLAGRAQEGVAMVALIEAWFKTPATAPAPATPPAPPSATEVLSPDDLTSALLYDFRRFIMEFMDPIVTSTLHIYSSALALMPSETALSRQYGDLAEGGVRVIRGRAKQWSQKLWTTSKHSQGIICVAVSPDGTTIVSGSEDTTLRLWDARTGAAIGKALEGHTQWVNCVAISPDGMTLVSGSWDTTLRLWDAKTGAAIGNTMKGHSDQIICVVVSPNGKIIVSGSLDRTLRLWDVKTGMIRRVTESIAGGITCVTVSPDSTTIVTGSWDAALYLWDAETGAMIGQARVGHTSGVICIAASPNGAIIVSGSEDTTLRLWDAKTGEAIGEVMEGHTSLISCVAVTPDSTTIISGSHDNTLRLWDARTGAAIGRVLEGHTNWVDCIAVSPDSTTIVSGSSDNILHLWDAKTGAVIGKAVESHTSYVSCVAISPNSPTIISGFADGTISLWDATTMGTIEQATVGHTSGVTCITVSPDGTTIASGSHDTTLWLWDTKTGGAIGKAMEGHTSFINCIAVSPDSRTMVSGSDDCTLHLWDAKTGAVVGKAMEGHTSSVDCVAVFPNNATIVSGSADGTLQLWDAKTGGAIGKALEGHTSGVSCIVVSPDGTTIVSGSSDCTLCLWNAKTGAPIRKMMEGHTAGVICIAVSPNSMTIFSGSWDTTLHMWDGKTGAAIGKAMEGHTHWVTSLAFSIDGMYIASMSEAGAEHFVWSCTSRSQLPDAEAQQILGSGKMPKFLFNIDRDGWVWCSGSRRLFWLPVDLRGKLVGQGKIIAVENEKVPVFDISAYVS
ncbi:hypothetical protein FRB95_008073 [Tulasnella sp. JGI-2019a]|nr:hypothetical protein FRB95_008073 [Tulasnella sp. JGI-2019a]